MIFLRAAVRNHGGIFLRAYEQDPSHSPPGAPRPEAVATGAGPYLIVGAMAVG